MKTNAPDVINDVFSARETVLTAAFQPELRRVRTRVTPTTSDKEICELDMKLELWKRDTRKSAVFYHLHFVCRGIDKERHNDSLTQNPLHSIALQSTLIRLTFDLLPSTLKPNKDRFCLLNVPSINQISSQKPLLSRLDKYIDPLIQQF